MRRSLVLAFISISIAWLGCGAPTAGPCALPAGCEAVARIDGACSCTAWETVSSEAVALPYVVVSVTYPLVGAATTVRQDTEGTNIRAVVRRADGSEQIARLGVLEDWSLAEQVSPTEIRTSSGGGIYTSQADLPAPASRADSIAVWTNATVTVRTDARGEKIVDWSTDARSYWPGLFVGAPQVSAVTPAFIRGDVYWDETHAAWLATLDAEDRAGLLDLDPRESGQTLDLPRYEWLANVPVEDTALQVDATWRPCAGADDFEVLAETTTPMPGGDTLVLQYGVQRDSSCTPQRPGILVASSPGCTLVASLFMDRLAGTLLMSASSPSPGCTAP